VALIAGTKVGSKGARRFQQRYERLCGSVGGAGSWPWPSARLPSRLGSCC